MLVVYLDPYFLGDPLFVPGLAQDLAAREGGLVLVHGSGERGERALESLGRMPTAVDGVWQTDDAESRETIERAIRDLNREIVHELNEAGVSAIRVMGADRGLLKSPNGALVAGRTGWLGDLVGQGVVAVVAALVEGAEGPAEVDAAESSGVLAEALGVPLAVLTTRSVEGGGAVETLAEAFPDPSAAARAVAVPGRARAGLRVTLRQAEGSSAIVTTG
ncbi:hypothetical protein [Rubrivirga marina]|uniref:Acetylglutamate kinase n=1 Tax=Rubrivirga marina TaxID=1196024 RepID=A0A271J2C6_9BACT|nr:hypothetical protein [Rubrivirga marina]PAP77418.1 hypothetical protein BSZ37_13715 [Rubrivirga marina]